MDCLITRQVGFFKFGLILIQSHKIIYFYENYAHITTWVELHSQFWTLYFHIINLNSLFLKQFIFFPPIHFVTWFL
jgi:hypothetical protein